MAYNPQILSLINQLDSVNTTDAASKLYTVRNDQAPSKYEPTSGKKHDRFVRYNNYRNELMPIEEIYFDIEQVYKKKIKDDLNVLNSKIETNIIDIIPGNDDISKAVLGVDIYFSIVKRAIDLMDLEQTTVYDIKEFALPAIIARAGPLQKTLSEFIADIETLVLPDLEILKKKIDKEAPDVILAEPKQQEMKDANNPDKIFDIPKRNLSKWLFDYEMFYIRPDGVKVNVGDYISNLNYIMEYDTLVMPIYSVELMATPLIVRDFKENLEQLRFFLTVNKWIKAADNTYIVKTKVIDNQQLIPLDPDIPGGGVITEGPLVGVPTIKIKIDLVSKRNVDLNSSVKSKILNNVTMLDVITFLLNQAYQDQKKKETSEKDIVKFVIAPPDNITKYEQIVLDPGSLAQNLKQLQEKYGVYRTGIRVMFDTVTLEKDPATGAFTNNSVITVQDKGGSVPPSNAIDSALIEIIDPVSQKNGRAYESGSEVSASSSILVIRTMENYHVTKKNSSQFIDGESVRVMGSSQNDWALSECDINDNLDSPQRTYWNNNDNAFALTQLQDSIKEKNLMVAVQLVDVDAYSLNQNMKYNLKFYNADDIVNSGEYRIKSITFGFSLSDTATVKKGVSLSTYILFTDVPVIQVNGTAIPRESYVEKVKRLRQEYNYFSTGKATAATTSARSGSIPSMSKSTGKAGPFISLFVGRLDYLGNKVPKEIPPSYKMSEKIKFEDTYITKDGAFPDRGMKLCNDFTSFCFAQKFSSLILDPIINKCGKFIGGGGRPNSFYRYHVPSNGSSSSNHLISMAADMVLSASGGNLLCEPFHWIAHSDLPFDQVIIEGNGSEWRWIHVSMNCNGNNRKKVYCSPTGSSNKLLLVNMSLFTSPDKAKYDKFIKELR